MATITLTFDPATATRIEASFTYRQSRPATGADIKAFLIASLKDYVRFAEHDISERAVNDAYSPVDVT